MIKFRQALFWDTNPDKIDVKKNAQYIIERVLDFGRDNEVKWLYHFYDKPLLKSVVAKSRSLMPETKNLLVSGRRNGFSLASRKSQVSWFGFFYY